MSAIVHPPFSLHRIRVLRPRSSIIFRADWRPLALDQRVYDHYWPFAETTGTGSLGGAAVVAFMSKTGLDKSVLRAVWAAANLRSAQALNKFEFYVAMRLIQLAQAGQPVSREAVVLTATTPLPAPRFEGVPPPPASPAAAMPAPSAPAAAAAAGAGGGFGDFGAMGERRPSVAAMGMGMGMGIGMGMAAPAISPWSITPAEAARYDAVFRAEDTDADGRITGQQAVALLSRSGLDKAVRLAGADSSASPMSQQCQ